MKYRDFLETKAMPNVNSGFDTPYKINSMLFDFQKDIVKWALKKGKTAIFADCGLGKTPIQLEWAFHVHKKENKPILIFAPLAVSKQTQREGIKFKIDVNICGSQDGVINGINITNYEKIHKFDLSRFVGIVLDESSILKSYSGKFRNEIIEKTKTIKYKLACTATPAPNDFMELGNHSEFLGIMTRSEMLAMFFIHDSGKTQKWRLKGHADSEYWKWLCTWAVTIRKPSDLGYEDNGFILPKININEFIVECAKPNEGELFVTDATTLQDRQKARRNSIKERTDYVASLINGSSESWLIWCNLNDESMEITKKLNNATEIAGRHSDEKKERAVLWFKGETCKCGLTNYLHNDKLAINNIGDSLCGRKSMPKIEEKNMPKAKRKEKEEKNKPEIAMKIKNICENGLKIIPIKSKHIEEKLRIKETPELESCIQKIPNDEKKHLNIQENGEEKIQQNFFPKDLSNMELQQKTIIECAMSKKENVQFAAKNKNDSTLTIATKQIKSEDCCVLNAISDSGNSKIVKSFSEKQLCTCRDFQKNRTLVSKPKIFGFGLNLQHCSNVVFVGLSDSYEQYYQAVRRCWRFGQKKEVNVHIIVSNAEGSVLNNIHRKEKQAQNMASEMIKNMKELSSDSIHYSNKNKKESYMVKLKKGRNYEYVLGDCIEETLRIEDDSVHYSIFSPPFAELYTYSDSVRDMGNSKNYDEFFIQFGFIVKELHRIAKLGRLVSVHCIDIPAMKERDGYIGIKDFPGDIIRLFQSFGFIYHSRVTIWKNPLIEATRTKALGLMHKQLCKDSSKCRQGLPDYLITFRKKGNNESPINNGAGLNEFIGENEPTESGLKYSHEIWRRYASPVWMDIRQSNTLNKIKARENKDEKHICPLQLDVIGRGIELWSNKGETIFDPFGGIASCGYQAILMDRKFKGIELKESYWKVGCENLHKAENSRQQDLFDL